MTPVEKKAQNEAANRAGQKAELAPKSIDKPAKSTPDDDDGSLDQAQMGPFVESCVGDAGNLGIVFNPGPTALSPHPASSCG